MGINFDSVGQQHRHRRLVHKANRGMQRRLETHRKAPLDIGALPQEELGNRVVPHIDSVAARGIQRTLAVAVTHRGIESVREEHPADRDSASGTLGSGFERALVADVDVDVCAAVDENRDYLVRAGLDR